MKLSAGCNTLTSLMRSGKEVLTHFGKSGIGNCKSPGAPADFRFQIANCRFKGADFRFQIADFRLQIWNLK